MAVRCIVINNDLCHFVLLFLPLFFLSAASVQIAAGTSTNSAAEGDASQQNVCVTVMATAGTSIESTLTVSFALSGKTSKLLHDYAKI